MLLREAIGSMSMCWFDCVMVLLVIVKKSVRVA